MTQLHHFTVFVFDPVQGPTYCTVQYDLTQAALQYNRGMCRGPHAVYSTVQYTEYACIQYYHISLLYSTVLIYSLPPVPTLPSHTASAQNDSLPPCII